MLQGVKGKVSPQTKVTYVKGCDVTGTEEEIQKAKVAAAQASVALVVLGEDVDTDREGADSATLELQGRQMDLVKAVYETKTPTIVVLINGRPMATPWIAENVPGIVEAWNCGEKGGQAVAEVLFGDYNPSGHMAISVPRHAGQLPVYYNRRPSRALTNRRHARYIEFSSEPLYPFGFGLSYTNFDYTNLRIKPDKPTPGDKVSVSVDVKNIGSRAGDDVVQLYVRDVVSSTVRPVIELKGFERISLEPGQAKKVNFTITPDQLTFVDPDLNRVLEPGTFEVMIGKSSEDIAAKGSFELVR